MSESKEKTVAKAAEVKAELRVRMTAARVKARGFVFGKGAEVLLPEDKARALEKAGMCQVIGV